MASRNATNALPPCIRDAIQERFDEIDALFGAYCGGSANTALVDQTDCLSKAVSLRGSILDHVESLFSDLRFRLSVSARINQLPDDILVHMMSTMSFNELVNATHVCHRWRKLGVGTPALWSRLTVTDKLVGDLDALLARSKAASLDLEISISHSPTRSQHHDAALLAESDMARVRSLTIRSGRVRLPKGRDHYYDFSFGLPAPREEAPQMPLCPAPRLEILRVDSRHAFSLNLGLSIDCSMLREAYIIRGVFGVRFLRPCSLLRVLVLHVPSGVTGVDVLGVVRANPALRILELHVPPEWDDDEDFWGGEDAAGAPITCGLELLIVRPEPAGSTRRSQCHGILLLMSQFDCSQIPEVDVSCCFSVAGDALGDLLLAHVREVISIALGPDTLRLQDTRGHVRCFVQMAPSHPLKLALAFIGQVRSLDARLSQWSTLPSHSIMELSSLEDLTLWSGARELGAIQGGAACPALRKLTVREWHEHEAPQAGDEQAFVAVAMSISRGRLPRCPPLELLTIVRLSYRDGTPLEDQTLRLDPPFPRTVFVTSAVSDVPKLLAEPDSIAPGWDSAMVDFPPIWNPAGPLSQAPLDLLSLVDWMPEVP